MSKLTDKKVKKARKLKFYIINIKIRYTNSQEDIPSSEYTHLFREFYLSGTAGRSSRQKECLLTTQARTVVPEQEPVFWGQFVQITNFDNKKWFDKISRSLDPTFKIPEKYAGNAAVTEYVFIPDAHRFCYLYKSSDYIQPYNVKAYFQEALGKFLSDGYILHVDVETDRTTIQRIYEAPVVKRLTLKINYSNNDFAQELQEWMEDDLRNSNVGELEIKAVQKDKGTIEIKKSEILTGALESSVSNGEAEATIIDHNGKPTKLNTKSFPNRILIEVNEDDDAPLKVHNAIMNEFRRL